MNKSQNSSKIQLPKKGFAGFKQNWKADITSGFMVFLLALPLSLGIAKASGFPVAMGVLTAIIGGLFSSFFKVSPLTIKGPAAGLITVCSGAILEFGGGELGWQMTAGVIVVAALLQVVFGLLKFGSLSDFFPHSVVHGMLAAIGIIIIAKQIPVLLGDEPKMYVKEGPIQLLLNIPKFLVHANWRIAVVGVLSLVVMFGLPLIGLNFLKKIPAPMVVLIFAIPLSLYWHFEQTEQSYSLVSIGDFWGSLGINANFTGINSYVFWKYVLMFLFVNSIESLLTVKAVDNLDPYRRSSDYNGDLKAVGFSNAISGFLGGLPMISEVVRSSANIGFGAITKWSNFFHGLFLLIAMILIIPIIELIPNAALAAMLIYAGYSLASPKEFIQTYHIGKEQLIIFITTIAVTLGKDLLVGIFAGIITKFIIHLFNGATFKGLFKANNTTKTDGETTTFHITDSAIFSNLIGHKKALYNIPIEQDIIIDFSETILIDHSFMNFITRFKRNHEYNGGTVSFTGLNNHKSFTKHPLSTKKLITG